MVQPKIILKAPVLESSRSMIKLFQYQDYTIPPTRSGDDSSSRMVKRKPIQGISREIPMYPVPI